MIPISAPTLGDLEENLVLEVLHSGRLVQGPMVERFEEAVRQAVNAQAAVAVNNGTTALIAALMAHDVGPGDEVITTPFTFVATLNAILQVGAIPRFADVGADFNLDPESLARATTTRTRAILPVHLYGRPADMTAIAAHASKVGAVIIEDAAQALGASDAAGPVGSRRTACFSFYATKNVTTGEGGVVTTDRPEIAETLRLIRNQGQRGTYDYAMIGFNFRMTELQAAVGVGQMARLPRFIERRRANARMLTEGLREVEGLVLPVEPDGGSHGFHQYTIQVTESARLVRDELAERLHERGVDARVYYPRPVYDYPVFRADSRIGIPHTPLAEQVAREVLSLPVHPALTAADVEMVAASVRDLLA